LPKASTIQDFYRNLLNSQMKARPIYIEYDQASAPIAPYLHPQGLGYLFAVSDTLPDISDDSIYFISANEIKDIESIRTWVLWFQNRGEYLSKLGHPEVASKYMDMVETLALKAPNP